MKKNWAVKRLKEICQIRPPKKESKEKLGDDDKVSFLPMEDLGVLTKSINVRKVKTLKEVYKGYTYFRDGDVLLAKITPCFENGKLGVARNLENGVGFGSSEYIVMRSKGDITPDYLYYFLSRDEFRLEGQKVMTGAVGHKRVPLDYVENVEIAYPKDISEQQRIITIIEETFKAIDKAKENTEKNLKDTQEILKSYQHRFFANENWEKKKLDEVCELISGQHIAAKDYNIEKNGIGYLTGPSDFGTLNPSISKWTEHPKVVAKKDDILITVKGSGIGKVNILNIDEAAISRQIMAIRVNKAELNFIYTFLDINYDLFQSLGNGTAIPGISRRNVLNLQIPLPPLAEQQLIVNKIKELSVETKRLEEIYQKKLTNLDELKKSILKKAFSGEL